MSTTVETNASTPRGLRGFGSDDDRFLRFFSIVQDAAKELGCVFFCWAGEGNELETDTMDGEDLSGWLVPKDLSDEFEAQWDNGIESIGDKFDKFDVFARWTIGESGNVSIRFE
ncbi:MAG: hypothetical protein ACI4B6_01760 [Atopobiaceae bacterium]